MIDKNLSSILFVILLGITGVEACAQKNTDSDIKDYSNYPYWIDMMQDPKANFFEIQKAFYTYWEGREVTRGNGYKPFKRWEYYWQFRVNPDGTFPAPDHVYREFMNYSAAHPVDGGLKTGQPAWKELGPKTRENYGGYVGVGRVNAIAFHPADTATIYVGAPSGGFWITHDNGRTWSSPTDIMPTLGVSAILVDQTHPDLILIGTGDRDGGNSPGMGVFRSDDGGITFYPFNNGMGNVTVGMFDRAASDHRIILAAANGGIFKTLDGGENWVRTSPDNSNFRDVKFKPGSTSTAYATSNNGFYRSTDGGDSWTLLPFSAGYPQGSRLVIGVTPADDKVVYLVAGAGKFTGCFRSNDSGLTFATQSTSPNILGYAYEANDEKSQAWYDLDIHIDPENPQIVHVGGVNLWRSDDSGKTWKITGHWWGDRTNEVHADQHAFAYNPLNKKLYAGNDGGIYYTGNQGGTWKEISEGLGIGQLYKLGVANNLRDKVTAGFQDNGSATWMGTYWVNSGGGDGMECAVDPFDSRYSYTTIYYGPITQYFNNGGGRGIAGKNTYGITEDGAWVTPFLISEGSGNTMVIGYKNIWISNNIKSSGNIKWVRISNSLAGNNDQNMAVLEQSSADFNILYAARYDGRLFRTDNLMGDTVLWTDISNRLPAGGTPSDLECHPYDPKTVYLAVSQKIYKSGNLGSTWVDISGSLPHISINSIACDKTSRDGLYIGTDAGVYYRDADMSDWILFGLYLPVSVRITELEIYYDRRNRDDSRLRASTYGRGLWEIPLAFADPVLQPTRLTAEKGPDYIDLSWEGPFYQGNITGYRVFRNGELLATVNSFMYTDEQIEKDLTYTYKVAAVYTGNIQSGFSNEVSVTIISPVELPYSQDFERGTGGWLAKYAPEGWKYGTADELGVTNRAGRFFAANSVAAGEGINISDYLMTPEIDLSMHAGKTVTLKFAYSMRKYRTYDKFSLHYRPSPDSAWVKMKDFTPPSKNDWVWDTTELNLPEKALTHSMQIGFYYSNSNQFAWGAAVDDVQLFINTTRINNLDNHLNIKVYPNPAKGRFLAELPSMPGNTTYLITDNTGRIILERQTGPNPARHYETFDLTGQPKGIYYLIARSGSTEWKEQITIH